jgi:hypothetical protein
MAGERVKRKGSRELYGRRLYDGTLAVGLFNRGFSAAEVPVTWSDLKLAGQQPVPDLWRHCFALAVSTYGGSQARGNAVTVTLPKGRTDEPLLPGAKQVTVTTGEAVNAIQSSLPLSLVDHRRWGTVDYLLAGYPVQGAVPAGKQWSVEIRVAVSQSPGR